MLRDARKVAVVLQFCCFWNLPDFFRFKYRCSAQASTDDLKKQMQTHRADRNSGSHGSKGQHAKKEKEEEPSEPEIEKEEEEELSEASPTGAPYGGSGSEPEEAADDEDNDDDVFNGDFKTKTEQDGIDGMLAKLPSKLKSTVDLFDRDVLELIPSDISP